jgi:hypothetical protein
MSFLDDLSAQRQQLLDALEANQGDINLGIFEDFYPDEAHFIYELLQNAEDAGASEVCFDLKADGCSFEHDGTRHFCESDIKAITGIFSSGKKDVADKIGRFGVGFKSVFVYTDSPIVYSKHHSFQIVQLVLPRAVPSKPGLGERTRFEFPFNSAKKSSGQAQVEIKAGLEQLSETTLLFLRNIRSIRWTAAGIEGTVVCQQHSADHVEVQKNVMGTVALSSHWLRFSAPVDELHRFSSPVPGIEQQRVAVAFKLEFSGALRDFDSKKPLSEQLKIVPAQGNVSVFFPAAKEVSGLRYHLHAPFIPELSRASIKNSAENTPLFDQLGRLSAKSLHRIKELGLLSGDFLAVLPNNDDQLSPRYIGIRESILGEMRAQELVPTHGGAFAPANRLVDGPAAMKSFLTDVDLAFVSGRDDAPAWVVGVLKNRNPERFILSLGLPLFDTASLFEVFDARARETTSGSAAGLDTKFFNWLASQTNEWHQALYAGFNKYCLDEGSSYLVFAELRLVRMAAGGYARAAKAFFTSGVETGRDLFRRVSDEVLTVGTRRGQQTEAREFLVGIGVRVPGDAEEIEQVLLKRYFLGAGPVPDKKYIADLKRFMKFIGSNPDQKKIFLGFAILKVESLGLYFSDSSNVYLDSPFIETGLGVYHKSLQDIGENKWPLSPWYETCGIDIGEIARFATSLGCESSQDVLVIQSTCYGNPEWDNYLMHAPGGRERNPINTDYLWNSKVEKLLASNNSDFSSMIWNLMFKLSPRMLHAIYRKNINKEPRIVQSRLVFSLSNIAWVPLRDGRFVVPKQASRAMLAEGLEVIQNSKWLELVSFETGDEKAAIDHEKVAAKLAEAGFKFKTPADLQRTLEFSMLDSDDQEQMLASSKARQQDLIDLPDAPLRNPERRADLLTAQALDQGSKESRQSLRTVSVGYTVSKTESSQYLEMMYTKPNGEMICQACKREMPFKLPSGEYYFEAVEVIKGSPKRFRETFLALCPNHAAMYRHANAQVEEMQQLIMAATSQDVTVNLAGQAISLYFNQTHMADLRTCLKTLEVEDLQTI